jgi:hypothetical protein
MTADSKLTALPLSVAAHALPLLLHLAALHIFLISCVVG